MIIFYDGFLYEFFYLPPIHSIHFFFLHLDNLKIANSYQLDFYTLEIKPCGFESRIRDMEAESYNRSDFFVDV